LSRVRSQTEGACCCPALPRFRDVVVIVHPTFELGNSYRPADPGSAKYYTVVLAEYGHDTCLAEPPLRPPSSTALQTLGCSAVERTALFRILEAICLQSSPHTDQNIPPMHEPFARRAPPLYYSSKGNISHDRATSNSAGRSTLAQGLILAWVECAVYSVKELIPRTSITSWQVCCLHMQQYVLASSLRGAIYLFCILLRFLHLSVLFRSRIPVLVVVH
ncbi:hypothetical protein KCU92_g118, partial [Aureobasidium melanogenum]